MKIVDLNPVRRFSPWLLFAWCCAAFIPAATAARTKVDFNFQIRPLVSDRCYKCHGPDEKSRKAKLRLDLPAAAYATSKNGTKIISPGNLEQSELWRRITSADPEVKMPPPDSNLALDPAEIETIGAWIKQGAEYRGHWAFLPVTPHTAPDVPASPRIKNEIDRFVLARLRKEGLQPSPPADRERLLRRVTFDLTGLPPAIAEAKQFSNDPSDTAFARVVERLLASPAYGERMAQEWLDVARFADTYGYQADRFNHLWPWRDWVIRAFNQNLSYEDFILWQIAGDLLPDATREQRLATAFNRNHRQTNEGGSVEEEYRIEYNADRVHTTGSAFLGLTFECARCHDHKYDPISQKDYYRLFAFFNSTDESGLYSHFTDSIPTPTLLLYRNDEQEERHREFKLKITETMNELPGIASNAGVRFESWLKAEPALTPLSEGLSSFSFDEVRDGKVAEAASTNRVGKLSDNPQLAPGKFGQALLFNGENSVSFDNVGAFTRTDSFSFSLWLQIPEEREEIILLHRAKAGSDAGSRGYQLQLENGYATFALIHFWPGNAIKVRSPKKLPLQRWVHVGVTYDGSSRAAGIRLYVDGAPVAADIVRNSLSKDITYGDNTPLTLAARFRCRGFKHGLIDEFKVFSRELSTLEMAEAAGMRTVAVAVKVWGTGGPPSGAGTASSPAGRLAQSTVDVKERPAVFAYYLTQHDPAYTNAVAGLKVLRRKESELIESVPEIMAMGDLPRARPTHVLNRGAYDAPGAEVSPGVPSSVLPWNERYPTNRLGLARWLVDPRNPLTARVAVNRYWQLFFGRGLVTTVENFGSQGDLPSHPELLDWLANWFVEHNWDVKALCTLIVSSATYQQSSETEPVLQARDPDNRLLARGPKMRLSAEMLRDQALASSGLLSSSLGGPSVKPYQPDGLWEEKSGTKYDTDKGEGLYRRSLYTFWKRTSPHPAMTTFDAPSRETCIMRRQTTTTPLQALVLLNDPQFVEAARQIAVRAMREGGSRITEQLGFIFQLVASRRPSAAELGVLQKLWNEQRDLFQADLDSAKNYLKTGASPVDPALDTSELAAHTVVASTLLNFDESIMKR